MVTFIKLISNSSTRKINQQMVKTLILLAFMSVFSCERRFFHSMGYGKTKEIHIKV